MSTSDWQFLLFATGTIVLAGFICLNGWAAAALLRRRGIAYNPLLHPLEKLGRLALVLICLLLVWGSGVSSNAFGFAEREPLANLVLGLTAGLVFQAMNHYGTRWAVARWGAGAYVPALLRAMLPHDRRAWVLSALALVPAALGEELLFRSLAIGGLSQALPGWALAVCFSAVFGLAHMPQGKLGVAGASLLGLLLSLLFLWRWSLLACTVAHFVVNLAQLVHGEAELRWLRNQQAGELPRGESWTGDV
ncbi:MAG: CPBP family intramembrane glutamic endopeptidase [Chloroflexota bacterium]